MIQEMFTQGPITIQYFIGSASTIFIVAAAMLISKPTFYWLLKWELLFIPLILTILLYFALNMAITVGWLPWF